MAGSQGADPKSGSHAWGFQNLWIRSPAASAPNVGVPAQGLGQQRRGWIRGLRRELTQKKRGLLRRVGGQPGSSRAGVGRGLGADRRTDRQGHAGTRAPQRRRGRRGEGPRSETPPPPGPGRGPGGGRAGAGQAGRVRVLPRPPRREPRAVRVPALKGAGPVRARA